MDSDNGSTRTGLEGRSMSLGAMTVMSYDIWKAKCAAEKKRLEEEGKIAPITEKKEEVLPMRKRAHTFIAPTETSQELPKVQPPNAKEKKGRYIVLPTIPAMKIFVDEEAEKKMENTMDDTSAPHTFPPSVEAQVQEMKITSPVPLKPTLLPQPMPVTTLPMPQTMLKAPISVVPTMPMAPALQVAPALQRQAAMPFTTQPNLLSHEQLMLLQNTILQQQNQALQQLLGLMPLTTTPSTQPDMMTMLRCQQQQLAMAKPPPTTVSEELLQSLLAQTRPQQPIFSHSM